MQLRTTEQYSGRYLACHVLVALGYLFLIWMPGQADTRYYALFGSIMFGMVVFFSIRSYVQAMFARTPPRRIRSPQTELPRVSVIIPSYNEERVLERSISSTLALDYPADKLELVYVYESTCTDRTETIILDAARRDARIKPIRRVTDKGGKAAVTNYGLQFATGDIIGVFDADHSLNPDVVSLAVDQLRRQNIGCVRGRCRTINREQNLLTRLVALERDVVERFGVYGTWRMGGFSTCSGGHSFFRRDIFDEIGTFDEDILTEDIDFSVKLHSAGYQVVVVPQMQSWEEVPASLESLTRQRRRWTRGWMQVWRVHALGLLTKRRVGIFKRADMLLSLTSAVVSGLLVALIPLFGMGLFGVTTSYFDETMAYLLWLFVSTTPLALALWAYSVDRNGDHPPPAADILLIPMLLPYIFVLFGISWLCLVDEFILNWPFAYVKTDRVGDGLRAPCHAL